MRGNRAIYFLTGAGLVLASVGAIPTAASAKTPALTNPTFAGYEVSKPKTYVKSMSATFVIPKITCKKNYSGVGPGLIATSTVDKKTNSYTTFTAGVGVGCEKHVPQIESILTVAGNYTNDLVGLDPGDVVNVSMTFAAHKSTVSIDDVTQKESKTRTGAAVRIPTGLVGNSGLQIDNLKVGLDPFGPTSFSKVEVNGKSLAAEKPSRVTWQITRKHKKVVLATTTAITKAKSFSVKFARS